MNRLNKILSFAIAALSLAVFAATSSRAVELDPKVLAFKLPEQINWGPVTPAGSQQAILFGDPSKPGLYGVLNKWLAGNHFSKPHFHPNDRFITVISGTWWVGTGPNFDPVTGSVPMPAGSFVTHYGKQVHWDGAKDVDAVLLIVGEGPATSTPFVAAPTAR
ncbi:MAG TPA: cupin domain-containing protein [Pseudolabrys sp.]|nr:cupin domain-containing protein [Pseudolabrys sp.]